MNVPMGYLQMDENLSAYELYDAHKGWSQFLQDAAKGEVSFPVLPRGIRFVEFKRQPVLKAVCLHCGAANLHSSLECGMCGAPMVDNDQKLS